MAERRASREEIFLRLDTLLGNEAVKVVQEFARLYGEGATEAAWLILKEYDRTLGGVGIYTSDGSKLPGVYRPLSYVDIAIRGGIAHEYSRVVVQVSVAYLEELLKKLARDRSLIDNADRLSLGMLMKKIRKRLPPGLAEDLEWLNSRVWVFAKHYYDLTRDGAQLPEPEHYFETDEALAVYLIARALGRKLETLS